MNETCTSILFAFRLAWRQLTVNRIRLFTASLGVSFACFLVFMQIGFRDSLYASVELLPETLNGDLFVIHQQTEALWRTAYFPKIELARAFASKQVEVATPLYVGFAQFKNPTTMKNRTIMAWGYDHSYAVLGIPALIEQQKNISQERVISFDELSRPEFGDIRGYLAHNERAVEINHTRVEIWGTFKMGASFSAEGNIVTNSSTFFKIFSYRNPGQVDIGVIKLAPGSNVLSVQRELRKILSPTVRILTKPELTSLEVGYWKSSAPVGFIFGLGAVLGLTVGMVLTYQVLFTDISNNIKEYATLRAMGYRFRYLAVFVTATSIYLAVIGFFPGLLLSLALYEISESVTYIPMPMSLGKIVSVFLYILSMSVISGVIAMNKLKSTNPADMF
jgi:putative ABC transport system permease protein